MHRSRFCLALAAFVLGATPSLATTTYRVTFNGNDLFQGTPVWRAESYALNASNGTGTFTGEGFSYPGHVGCFDRVDMTWASGLSGGDGASILVSARSTDFVISGPAGPTVTGTLHFRVGATFARLGGFDGHGAHGSSLEAQAVANDIWATGIYAVNNAGTTTATGIFQGQSGNAVDVPFSISGTFPVGSPFFVDLLINDQTGTYGNDLNANPGFAEANDGRESTPPVNGGLRLEEVGGAVMELPAGYTLDSPDWGVVNNHFQSTVAVAPAPPAASLAVTLRPNPAIAGATIELALPRSARAHVALFDAAGRLVRTLAAGRLDAGVQRLRWDGRDESGAVTPAGVYFVRAAAGDEVVVRRLVRVR
jgi:hypothetical protein